MRSRRLEAEYFGIPIQKCRYAYDSWSATWERRGGAATDFQVTPAEFVLRTPHLISDPAKEDLWFLQTVRGAGYALREAGD